MPARETAAANQSRTPIGARWPMQEDKADAIIAEMMLDAVVAMLARGA